MTSITLNPTKGHLLVSVPFLNDYYFARSVVLLTENNDDGAIGLILNKKLDTHVSEAVKEFTNFDDYIHLGGPVDKNSLFYIHTLGNLIPDSEEIMPGLYWGGTFSVVQLLMEQGQLNPGNIKFFAGYSGWAPNQLNRELKEKSWVISKDNASSIMSTNPDEYWKNQLKGSRKKEYSVWADYPVNPSLN